MSKILLFTDNHYCENSSIVRQRGKKYSLRLENQIETLNWINDIAVKEKVDKIICLGDFFDSPNLNAEEISALKEINWCDIPKEFIVGNHEMGSINLEFNSANVLSKIGKVIYEPTMTSGYGYELIYLPYIVEHNRKSLKEYVEKIRKDYWTNMWTTQEYKYTIILSHNDLAGIRFGQYESKNGFNINEIEESCNLFINGHLHNQQQMSEKILNLGNVTGQNFSEDGTKYSHCIAILDTETLKVDLINNPYAIHFYKFDIITEDDFEQFQKCLSNSFISIRASENLISKVKETVSKYNNIIECRVTSIPNLERVSKQDISEIISKNHIQQFKDSFIESNGLNDIIKEELERL